MIPRTIIMEPRIFVHVIDSPKSRAEKNSTKIKLVPLNIYAVESGIRLIICCHSKAYVPKTTMAPNIHTKYGHDINSCFDAILVKIAVQA